MTKNEIIEKKNKVRNNLSQNRLKEAFDELKYMSESAMAWEITDEISRLEESYRLMLNYTMLGVEDPSRMELYGGIVNSLKLLLNRIVCLLLSNEESTLYYNTLRFERLRPNDSISNLIKSYCETVEKTSIFNIITSCEHSELPLDTLKEKERLEQRIFNRLWVTFPLSSEDEETLKSIMSSNEYSQSFQELLISALLLGAIEYYDPRRLKLLLFAYQNENQVVSVKAFVAILIIMYHYPQELNDSKIINHINSIKETSTWENDVKTAYLEFVRTRDTERISRKMQDELIPEMLKLRPDIYKKLNDTSGIIDISSIEENPEWDDMLKNSGITEKIKELNELQEEGSDVFMSTFSHLKSFPFFSEIANWFLPFSLGHSLVADTLGTEVSMIGNIIENAPFLCNSDKYSFLLSLGSIPESQHQLMLSQFEQQRQVMNDAGLSMSALTIPNQRKNIMNKYLQDLYRFFKLFRRKGEFADPFSRPINLINIPLLSDSLNNVDTLTLVAEFYFRRKYYSDALDVYISISEKMPPSASLFQKIGYCYQQLGDVKNALKFYEQAELLNSDSIWTLRRIGGCFRALNKPSQALSYYERVEAANPDDLNVAINIGHCFLELGNYTEAIKYYYKVEFLDDKSTRAWRPLAWCLMLSKDFEQSKAYYNKILNDNPTNEDFLNIGHLNLAQGRILDAIDYYKMAIKKNSSDINWLIKSLRNDEKYLIKIDIDVSIIPFVIDSLLYSID